MYKHRNVISAVILTFFLTSLFYLTAGSNVLNFIGAYSGDSFSKLKRVENLIDKYYIDKYDKTAMEDAAIKSYVDKLGDRYSSYISNEEFENFETMIEGNYKGIGVEVYIDDNGIITVLNVYENSPAEKSGICANDKLLAANDKDISVENYNEALAIIKGVDDDNDTVKLTVSRNDEIFDVDVKREDIEINYISTNKFDDIFYIRISSFEGHSADQFDKAIDEAVKLNSKGIIIDLRNNPGGTLESVLSIADRILKEGNILTIKSRADEEIYTANDEKSVDIPICLLVNENTASAAEVLTAALCDNDKAQSIGTKTFGKGVVQNIYLLGDNSALKVTSSKYYTPAEVCVNKVGISPDIELDILEEYKNLNISTIPFESDNQLQKAIEILNK